MDTLLQALKRRRTPFSQRELAEFLGVTPCTVRTYTRKGRLTSECDPHDGRRIIYPVATVRAYLRKRARLSGVAS